jgi:hypothetical protein
MRMGQERDPKSGFAKEEDKQPGQRQPQQSQAGGDPRQQGDDPGKQQPGHGSREGSEQKAHIAQQMQGGGGQPGAGNPQSRPGQQGDSWQQPGQQGATGTNRPGAGQQMQEAGRADQPGSGQRQNRPSQQGNHQHERQARKPGQGQQG